MSMKKENSKSVPNKLKKGWQQLSPEECPEGIIKIYAKDEWFVFIHDMVFVREGALIESLASEFKLKNKIEYCDFIWPMSVENLKYTGKMFLFIKKEVIEKFKENFKFELCWKESLDQKIIQ